MLIIQACEICGNKDLLEVLNLGYHPLCDDLLPIGSKEVNKEYKIEILFCPKCLSAHQKYQINKELLFPKSYHYRAKETKDVQCGMQGLVESLLHSYGSLENKNVLDIGCNDGSLLNYFKKCGSNTFGIEPTNAAIEVGANHKVLNKYFDINAAREFSNIEFDFITFTNVFAHISHLDELLEALRVLIQKKTKVVIENHYLGAVLSNMQFDTFYHEHPRTYSLKSFEVIAKRLGLNIEKLEFPSRYGGNIRVVLGSDKIEHSINESGFLESFRDMEQFIAKWRIDKKEEIMKYIKEYGRLPAKAFPGRGAILLKLLGLNESHILAIYEKPSSKKIGFYAPSSKIEILSDEVLFNNEYEVLLNIAWHIKDEIRAYLKNARIKKIIDLL